DEISHGIDELGVLLMGHARGAYWYGSQLSIEEARRLVPCNNATSLQVTAAVLAGVVWALENPRAGVVEPDEMDFERCLKIMRPYLGKIVGAYSDWTPLDGRMNSRPPPVLSPMAREGSSCGERAGSWQSSLAAAWRRRSRPRPKRSTSPSCWRSMSRAASTTSASSCSAAVTPRPSPAAR